MGDFKRPAVLVYQQFVKANVSVVAPFFDLCIVGPAYSVIRDAAVKNADDLIHQDYRAGEAFRAEYPQLDNGQIVDRAYTSAYLSDSFVKIWPEYVSSADVLAATIQVVNDEKVTKVSIPATSTLKSFTASGVQVGDVIYVKVGARVTQATISSFKDPQTAYLSKNIATPLALNPAGFDGDVTIIRAINGDVPLPIDPASSGSFGIINGLATTDEEIRLTDTLVITIAGKQYRMYSGNLFVTYRALIAKLAADFTTVTSLTQATGIVGAVDPDNPAGIAMDFVYSNAGIRCRFLGIASDTNEGYIKALDLLGTNKDIYVVVPLTQDKEVIAAYKNHVHLFRTGDKSQWRKMYANLRLPDYKVVVEQNDGILQMAVGASVAYILDSANGVFATKQTSIGDYIDIYDAISMTYQFSLMVKQILNDSVAVTYDEVYMLTTEGYTKQTGANAKLAPQTNPIDLAIQYQVTRALTPNGKAQEMVATAKSYAEAGVTLIGPSDEFVKTINGVDYILPAYFLCVAYGALRAAFPPHQSFTEMSIGGVKTLRHSNKYFTDDDLNLMAGGGFFVVVQDTADSSPYCIFQSTTDMTLKVTQEDSCVATIDFCSMYLRDNLKAALGKFNVNDLSVDFVRNVSQAVITKLTGLTYPYLGPVLTNGTVVSITKAADRIKPVINIEVPYPVNGVDVALNIANSDSSNS